MRQAFWSAAISFLVALVVGCSPTPSVLPTSSAGPTTGPSPSSAAKACVDATAHLRDTRDVILAEIDAPPTGIDPGFVVSPIPEQLGSGVGVILAHAACFSRQTVAAWRDANAVIHNPPSSGLTIGELRAIVDALPTEPLD